MLALQHSQPPAAWQHPVGIYAQNARIVELKRVVDPPTASKQKTASEAVVCFGGGGEIRTHERLPFAGFQDRCNRPLCHTSVALLNTENRQPVEAPARSV